MNNNLLENNFNKRNPPGPRGYELINDDNRGVRPFRDDKWLVYLNGQKSFVPAEVAKIIKLGLYIQKREVRYLKEISTLPKILLKMWYLISGLEYIPNADRLNEYNCHHTVACLDPKTKPILYDGNYFQTGDVRLLKSPKEYFPFGDYTELKKKFNLILNKDQWGIGQIGKYFRDESSEERLEAMHSFIVMQTDDKKDFICFEKVDFNWQYQLVSLEKIFRRYAVNFKKRLGNDNKCFYTLMPAQEVKEKIFTSKFEWLKK